jgi:hypothetical protein
MSAEIVLENHVLQALRGKGIISQQEVAIKTGDLYFAKDVLTNEKRLVDASIINNLQQNESLQENNTKTLLKG